MNDILSENDARAVRDILVEQLGVSEAQLVPESRLEVDLGADSLTRVEIALALEDRFHLSIPDEAWERVVTVGDVFEVLAEFLGKREKRISLK